MNNSQETDKIYNLWTIFHLLYIYYEPIWQVWVINNRSLKNVFDQKWIGIEASLNALSWMTFGKAIIATSAQSGNYMQLREMFTHWPKTTAECIFKCSKVKSRDAFKQYFLQLALQILQYLLFTTNNWLHNNDHHPFYLNSVLPHSFPDLHETC